MERLNESRIGVGKVVGRERERAFDGAVVTLGRGGRGPLARGSATKAPSGAQARGLQPSDVNSAAAIATRRARRRRAPELQLASTSSSAIVTGSR